MSATDRERMLAYVTEHPGSGPRDIWEGAPLADPAAFWDTAISLLRAGLVEDRTRPKDPAAGHGGGTIHRFYAT
ncbi:MAG TPA: hypothetical protein VGN59_07000 [Acidimicrobiia bacterium]